MEMRSVEMVRKRPKGNDEKWMVMLQDQGWASGKSEMIDLSWKGKKAHGLVLGMLMRYLRELLRFLRLELDAHLRKLSDGFFVVEAVVVVGDEGGGVGVGLRHGDFFLCGWLMRASYQRRGVLETSDIRDKLESPDGVSGMELAPAPHCHCSVC